MSDDLEVIEFEPAEFEAQTAAMTDLIDNAINDTINHYAPESFIPPPVPTQKDNKLGENSTQWAIGGNGKFMPIGSTVERLAAGVYEPFSAGNIMGLEGLDIASDGIYELPDMATQIVLKEVQKFWSSEAMYRRHKLLYKRGILLYGAPGGGKTVTVKLLMNELVKKDGIVVIVHNVQLATMVLKAFRRIEPKRNLIMVLEDLDEIIRYSGEAAVLSLLDGENNLDNVINLATTNYAEQLGPRIINRPSRFDRRVEIGMPGDDARREYLQRTTNNSLEESVLEKWVKDSNGLSIAHLRELVAAVYCLDQPYSDVLIRLQDMGIMPKDKSGFKHKSETGFGGMKSSQFATGV